MTGSAHSLAAARGLLLDADEKRHREWVAEVIRAYPDEVARLRLGERRLVDYLVGRVLAASGGMADPKLVRTILERTD